MPNPESSTIAKTQPASTSRRVAGPKVILAGVLIVLLITGFVVVRVFQTSRSAPDPEAVTEPPTASPTP